MKPPKDIPILMSSGNADAMLAGVKRQTRRIIHWPYDNLIPIWDEAEPSFSIEHGYLRVPALDPAGLPGANRTAVSIFPHWSPGDTLWVKENFRHYGKWAFNGHYWSGKKNKVCRDKVKFEAKRGRNMVLLGPAMATVEKAPRRVTGKLAWWPRPSMFMPRWASRVEATVTAVRPERLGRITQPDVLAEGVRTGRLMAGHGVAPLYWNYNFGPASMLGDPGVEAWLADPKASYASLWESVNGKGTFDENLWVWVLSFEPRPAVNNKQKAQ